MDPIALIASATAATAVVLIVIGVFGGARSRATDRLSAYPTAVQTMPMPDVTPQGPPPSVLEGSSIILGTLSRFVRRSAWSDRTARDLGRADLTLTPAEYLAFRLAAIIGSVAFSWLVGAIFVALRSPYSLVAAAIIGYVVPLFYVRRRQSKRLNAFNEHLADAVILIGSALRAGSSFLQSVELVSREMQPPVSTEFNRVVREVSIGLPLETALENMVERVRSTDLELMATAIAIQYQVGGNLAEILDTIAETIRERVRIKGEIRTLTAQQRLSGYVVGFLPVGLLGILLVIAPKFMNPMFAKPPELLGLPLGIFLLGIAAIAMLFGFFLIRRIVDIEV
jgi:tight adherence protein B